MKSHKLVICAVGAFFALFAAVAAIIVFKNEIVDFFVTLKEKICVKKGCCCNNGEFDDYADV